MHSIPIIHIISFIQIMYALTCTCVYICMSHTSASYTHHKVHKHAHVASRYVTRPGLQGRAALDCMHL